MEFACCSIYQNSPNINTGLYKTRLSHSVIFVFQLTNEGFTKQCLLGNRMLYCYDFGKNKWSYCNSSMVTRRKKNKISLCKLASVWLVCL